MTSHLINTILLCGCVGASYLFIVVYSILAAWYRTAVGRHIMTFTILLAAILTFLLLARLGVLGSLADPWGSIISTIIYGGLFIVLCRQTWILLLVQLRPYRARRNARKEMSNEQ